MTAAIVCFEELSKADTAGGKGANLGDLASAGLPVPPGFVVAAAGYLAAMDEGAPGRAPGGVRRRRPARGRPRLPG